MTADPAEGVDRDGFITTGADLNHLRSPYDAVLQDVQQTLTAVLGNELHSLYLYGSVATGQARAPDSDLDLAALVTSEAARTRCRELGEQLSHRHRAHVREVGVSAGLVAEALVPGEAGRAERCFLKHYCVWVWGQDLRHQFPRCRPDPALARQFIGDLDTTMRRMRDRLEQATTIEQVGEVATAVSRRLLLAAAVLYSTTSGTWTTDRGAGAELLVRHHPDHLHAVRLAQGYLHRQRPAPMAKPGDPASARDEVRVELLDRLARLVIDDASGQLPPLR